MRAVCLLLTAVCLTACGGAAKLPDPNAAQLAKDQAQFKAAEGQFDVFMVEPAAERLPEHIKGDQAIQAHYDRRTGQAKAISDAFGSYFQGGPNPHYAWAEIKKARLWLRVAAEMEALVPGAAADQKAKLMFASRYLQACTLNAGNALEAVGAHLKAYPKVKSKDVEIEIFYNGDVKRLADLKAKYGL